MKFQGQVALVTGASRGIGRAIALAFAAEGAAVAVNYCQNEEQAQAVVDEIKQSGGTAIAIAADVAEHEQTLAMVEEVIAQLGGLHILINNAGISRDSLVYYMEPGAWLEVMRVNFGGVFNCTKAVLNHFMAQREGSIVNVSSVMGERGWVGEANYAASKGAINAFTRCCALELARFNIRVNAVLPGFCPTELVAGLVAKDGGRGILKQLPTRSFARPEEVAQTVAFLASSEAHYITGSLLPIDGGASAILGVGSPLS
jgi:3-oxoacyl-[acyl-carrier protein] reductase